MQFPLYINHYRNCPITKTRSPLVEEKAYNLPYLLPSRRVVYIRGKFDCIYQRRKEIILQENKTKGEIDQEAIFSSVHLNLQAMIYHVAMREIAYTGYDPNHHFQKFISATKKGGVITGTLYNVVRRPLSDRFAIKQKKSESLKQFIKRIGEGIKSKPDYYFLRKEVVIRETDVLSFEKMCFIPILESLCDWWEAIKDNPFDPWDSHHHYLMPYGIYSSLWNGFRGDYYDLIINHRETNLTKVNTLFPELENE